MSPESTDWRHHNIPPIPIVVKYNPPLNMVTAACLLSSGINWPSSSKPGHRISIIVGRGASAIGKSQKSKNVVQNGLKQQMSF